MKNESQKPIKVSEMTPDQQDLLKLAKEKTDELLRKLKQSLRVREQAHQ